MSETQNEPSVNTTPLPVQGAEELLTEDPNVQGTKTTPQDKVVDEFEDYVSKANVLLAKKFDVIIPTTQEDMVMINETIKTSDDVRRTLNQERDKKRKYEMQGYAYPLKPEVKDLIEKLTRASNDYELRAQEYLAQEKKKAEEEAAKRLEESKANVDSTLNLKPIPRSELPPMPSMDQNGEQPKQEQPVGGDEMAPTSIPVADEPQNQGTDNAGHDDGSGGVQQPASEQPIINAEQAQAQPPNPSTELQGKGVKTNVENLQNLETGGQGAGQGNEVTESSTQ